MTTVVHGVILRVHVIPEQGFSRMLERPFPLLLLRPLLLALQGVDLCECDRGACAGLPRQQHQPADSSQHTLRQGGELHWPHACVLAAFCIPSHAIMLRSKAMCNVLSCSEAVSSYSTSSRPSFSHGSPSHSEQNLNVDPERNLKADLATTLQLGFKFPKSGAEGAHQHVVDLGRHSEAALMAAEGNTFPLIIRLETVTDRGAKEGHSLKVGCTSLALFRVLYLCRSSGGRRSWTAASRRATASR